MGINQYNDVGIRAEILGATPHRLIQMLFEGALQRIYQAKGAIERDQMDLKAAKINEAMAIVEELDSSLEEEESPEFVENMSGLYGYMSQQMMDANIQNDPAKLDEVAGIMTELKAAWDEIPLELREQR
ncbi:MAG: flagellar export chaperone FliS [Amphritea sp.]|nr:flagellar export chaperone FliS [Amphritea sp.]